MKIINKFKKKNKKTLFSVKESRHKRSHEVPRIDTELTQKADECLSGVGRKGNGKRLLIGMDFFWGC